MLADAVRLSLPDFSRANDLVAIPFDWQEKAADDCFSWLEKEIKFHQGQEQYQLIAIQPISEEQPGQGHLISDDTIRHLAFLPIFSPPPNQVA